MSNAPNGSLPWTRIGLLLIAGLATVGILLGPNDTPTVLQLATIAVASITAIAGISLPHRD